MKKVTVSVSMEFEVEYDPNSPEFQATLESYRSVIHGGAEEEDVIESAVLHVYKRGHLEMAEGIGFMAVKGRRVGDDDEQSGINVLDDEPYPEFSFYVHDTDEEE